MKFFHGSPKKFKILKPMLGIGFHHEKEQKLIHLTRTFKEAAFYAFSKPLEEKFSFKVTPSKLYILGKAHLKEGFVYEIQLNKDDIETKIKDRHDFSHKYTISNFDVYKVDPKDYEKDIIYLEPTDKLDNYK